MRLYEKLFKIDERVLYFDTDSIIFISNENHYEPELADYLGKLTNEIKGDNFIKITLTRPHVTVDTSKTTSTP
jgi:hypothetical protein